MDHGTGALLGGGIVLAAWDRVKMVLYRLTGVAVVHVSVGDGESTLQKAMRAYLLAQFATSPSSFRHYGLGRWFVQPHSRYESVAYETVKGGSRLFWYGWRPLLVTGEEHDDAITLSFIRGTFNPDTLMREAVAQHQEITSSDDGNRFSIQVCQGTGRQQTAILMGGNGSGSSGAPVAPNNGPKSGTCTIDFLSSVRPLGFARSELGVEAEGNAGLMRLALAAPILAAIKQAQRWIKSGDFYRERQIPWRRGWLLYGPPGTGKSSLAVALAQDLHIPLYRFDLASMNNAEFSTFWKDAAANTPCMVLIEDIDAVFKGRENIVGEMGGGLSFDHLLNTLSGIESADGVFLVVTTNLLTSIDPALGIPQGNSTMSTRPGRLDCALEMGHPSFAGRRQIAARILADKATPELIEQLVAEGSADSGAQFQDRCSMLALNLFWEKS